VRVNLKALITDANVVKRWQAGNARRCLQAPGRLPQDRPRRERHAGRGHWAAQRVGEVRGPNLEGQHPGEDHGHYNGDFNTIKNNLNQCIDAVNHLVADAVMLVQGAVDGKLATRADASKHNGDYRKVVQGVNDTLDAVIGPLNVTAKYVDSISKGEIPAKITDNYNGDFNTIKNNLNQCIEAVNMLVADAVMLAKAAVEGKLTTRADATKHRATSARSCKA
jgi:hypothetical protein